MTADGPENVEVCVQTEDFDPGVEMARLGADSGGNSGAVASFVGLVRGDGTTAASVVALELEHYPGMTERSIAAIVAQARQRWQLFGVRVIHRTGRLAVGDRIVFVGVASCHRGEAFAACEFIMDYLKTRAPFWKKAWNDQGQSCWVDARESDSSAAARWQ
jgi:molybdopterin synthase catalytic subunit